MRIAIAVSGPLVANGACRVARSWARILSGAGHEVALVCEAGSETLPAGDLAVHRYGPTGANRFTRVAERGRAAAGLVRRFDRERRLDLVIAHDPVAASAVRHVLPKVRLVQTFHSPFVEENRLNNWKYAGLGRRLGYPATRVIAERIERSALRSVHGVHTLSRGTWERLSGLYPDLCSGLEWALIPGTVDETFHMAEDRRAVRQRLGLPADSRVLLAVRRLIPRNGVDRILACAERVRSRITGDRFVIVGGGELESLLRRDVERRGLEQIVDLRGFVAEDLLPLYYQAADVLLVPTRDLECFGMPIIEAMACGCTPLVTPHVGPGELAPDPRFVAAENTTDAFVSLVGQWLDGRLPRIDPRALEADTRRRFSEEAVRSGVLAWVEARATQRSK